MMDPKASSPLSLQKSVDCFTPINSPLEEGRHKFIMPGPLENSFCCNVLDCAVSVVRSPFGDVCTTGNLLSFGEFDTLRNFRDSRRNEWVAGRVAAKVAAQNFLRCNVPMSSIEVINESSGKPRLLIHRKISHLGISISHTGSYAAAAVSSRCLVGIDVEVSRTIPTAQQRFFLTDMEQALLNRGNPLSFWVIKEAALKALGVGLNVPMKSIQVQQLEPSIRLMFSSSLLSYNIGRLAKAWCFQFSPLIIGLVSL